MEEIKIPHPENMKLTPSDVLQYTLSLEGAVMVPGVAGGQTLLHECRGCGSRFSTRAVEKPYEAHFGAVVRAVVARTEGEEVQCLPVPTIVGLPTLAQVNPMYTPPVAEGEIVPGGGT